MTVAAIPSHLSVSIGEAMADAAVPSVLPVSVAAALCSISRRTMGLWMKNGTVSPAFAGKGWAKPGVALADVEKIKGRKITREDLGTVRAAMNKPNIRGQDRAR